MRSEKLTFTMNGTFTAVSAAFSSYTLSVYEPDISDYIEEIRQKQTDISGKQEAGAVAEPAVFSVRTESTEGTGVSSAIDTDMEEINLSDNLRFELMREKLIDELKGVIFCNPEGYNENDRNRGWETEDEYLSGNVRDKLVIAEANAKLNPEIFGTNYRVD